MAEIRKIRVDGTDYDLRDTSKIPVDQGTANAGKVLAVGSDGKAAPSGKLSDKVDKTQTVNSKTLNANITLDANDIPYDDDPEAERVVGSVGSALFQRPQYNQAVRVDGEQSLTDAQKATGRGNIDAADVGSVGDLKSALDYNLPLLNLMPIKASSATILGVNISYSAGVLTSNGTATSSGGRLNHIVDISLEAGTYNISVYGDATLLVLHKSSDNSIIAQINARTATSATFTLDEKTDLFIGVNLINGRTYTQQVNISLVSGMTAGVFYPPEKRDVIDSVARATAEEHYDNSIHKMPSIEWLTDFNDAALNRIYLIINYDNVANMPTEASGTLLTYGQDTTAIVQLYFAQTVSYWYRRKWASSWSAWRQIADVSSIPSVDDILAKQLDVLPMFDNITCCGDSLTYSQVYTSATTTRKAKTSYPQVLAKITGTNVEEIASAGYTASMWWTVYANRISEKTNQCAIIYLGTNGGFTDTLDTDAPEGTSYADWAETNTGSLAKIVAKFKEVGAKVILVKCYATNGTGDSVLSVTNKVITDVAVRFECGLAENARLTDPVYHLYPDLSGQNTAHYNDIGYAKFARYLANNVSAMDSAYLQFIIPN